MLLLYFHERPYGDVPEDEVIKNRGFFGVPNRFFDPKRGSDLYNIYLDEMQYVEEVGLDGVVLNEHHGTPFCMGAVMDVEAAILARITKKIRIVLLGNPLPVVRNPIRLAEELAEIDMISRGRLVTGWVRGAGSEQLFNNVSPSLNREYFNEAHDLVVKCWTEPGPFRFEGKHFHFRFVNPWALPYQKPHPPIWIPGLLSPESVIWAAEHRYPYIGLGTGLKATSELWNIYADRAAQMGYQAGPENFGYLQNVYVAETEEKAQEVAKLNLYGGGGAAFARPEWTLPPGYNSKEATKRLARQQASSKVGTDRVPGAQRHARSAQRAGRGGQRPHPPGPRRNRPRSCQARNLLRLSEGPGQPEHHHRHPQDGHPKAQAHPRSAALRRLCDFAGQRSRHTRGSHDQHQAVRPGSRAGFA